MQSGSVLNWTKTSPIRTIWFKNLTGTLPSLILRLPDGWSYLKMAGRRWRMAPPWTTNNQKKRCKCHSCSWSFRYRSSNECSDDNKLSQCYENHCARHRSQYLAWLLYHDNAPSHTSMHVREFLAKHGFVTLSHAPYNLDLSLTDLFSCVLESDCPCKTAEMMEIGVKKALNESHQRVLECTSWK